MAKILYLTHSPVLYGANNCLLMLIEKLKERHNLSVFLNNIGPLTKFLDNIGVIYEVSEAFNEPLFGTPFSLKSFNKELLRRAKYLFKLHDFVCRNKIDIIHLNSFFIHYGAIIKLLCRVNVIWHIRETPELNWRNKIKILMMKVLADKIVFVSIGTRDHFNYTNENSMVIYDGREKPVGFVDRDNSIRQRKVIVGIVGEVSERKGADVAIKIANSLASNSVNFVFWGDYDYGDYYNYKVLKIISEEAQNNIIFKGFTNDMDREWPEIDILLHPARKDPFPGVILEAMSHGIPVVGSQVDGVPEMVLHNKTGFCFNVGDYIGGIEYLTILVKNKKLRIQFGKNGKEYFEDKFLLGNNVSQLEELYSSYYDRY